MRKNKVTEDALFFIYLNHGGKDMHNKEVIAAIDTLIAALNHIKITKAYSLHVHDSNPSISQICEWINILKNEQTGKPVRNGKISKRMALVILKEIEVARATNHIRSKCPHYTDILPCLQLMRPSMHFRCMLCHEVIPLSRPQKSDIHHAKDVLVNTQLNYCTIPDIEYIVYTIDGFKYLDINTPNES
jgi:hypothetical protein